MPIWLAKTHHDVLVRDHGLAPEVMLMVPCACGIKARRADYMVDVTPLPMDVRTALGIAAVDYLCDGCCCRLFADRHITQEEFNRLLGAPADNLTLVRKHDAEHLLGMQGRPEHHKVKHKPAEAGKSQAQSAPLNLKMTTLRHTDTVRERPMHFPNSPLLAAPAGSPASPPIPLVPPRP